MSITLEFINVTMLYHTLFHYRKKNEGALQESMILQKVGRTISKLHYSKSKGQDKNYQGYKHY